MELSPESCHLAILSHDRRFDGRFFTGIATTGIYCRPICPVRPAKFENMRFYPCAAAAEEAGFRPCRRCRPELSPGTPDWVESSAILSRSLRRIAAGALDDGKVIDLAREMGVSERQLRRIFVDCLGASPGSIARKRRVDFSMQLLEQTSLLVIQVAFAAGFRSVREFNHAFRRTFQMAPRDVRRRDRRAPSSGGVTLRLPYRPPFDWEGTLRFIAPRTTHGCESAHDEVYSRSIRFGASIGTITVHNDPSIHALLLEVALDSFESLHDIVERTRSLFDLGADPESVNARLSQDADLAPLVRENPGLRLPGVWDGFEFVVRAIAGETLKVPAPQRVLTKLVRQFGEPLSPDRGGLTYVFPSPSVLARATRAQLEQLGLSRAKALSVQALARSVVEHPTSWEVPAESLALVLSGLSAGGLAYVSMRLLHEPDAFPATDSRLRRRMCARSPDHAESIADRWRPWRAYAALHILRGPAIA